MNSTSFPGRFPAPAKINLYLRVRASLPNGYHRLETAFAYADVMDLLEISPAQDLIVSCTQTHLSGRKNLVFRVLAALRERHRIRSGLHVRIIKNIPEQAGLGGGSSDAATAIMIANRQWKLALSREELIEFALPFGADIPCFLFGHASRATGVGEQLTPYPTELPSEDILLAFPGRGVSTSDVFHHFDLQMELTRNRQPDTIRPHSGLNETIDQTGMNDLEETAISLCPAIGALLKSMRHNEGVAWMSGSGSACVGLLPSPRMARVMAGALQHKGLATWTHAGRLMAIHPMMSGS